ncbi:ATG8-interacting protein 2-like isoform X2 [Phalaenopsis equestris]|uniref:ATG8-interacting protein 2-like isoform X2 n=1 Tax=Phalaenopsis equestris TaxID=78828 RepID=UPI0009E61466|nr:ATG8-interacting protein 2-like isoform X2 [Phalaenopsis equestris]
MEDNRRDINEANTRGTDWEVVSLTASTYAAAPGPQGFDPTMQHKKDELNKNEQECSETMFMSKHFDVASQEPKKLPAENYYGEIYNVEEVTEPEKSYKYKSKSDSNNDLHGSQLFGIGRSLSDCDISVGDEKQEKDLKMAEKEHDFFVSPNNSSFDNVANVSLPVIHDDISDLAVTRNPSEEKLDYSWREDGCKPNEDDNESYDDSSESWWKKRAISVYNHAKGTNTFWSIFVAVAVAGLVFLGQRWRREKSQFQQFKWKFNSSGENSIAGPVSQLKFLAGGNHRYKSMSEGLHPTF